MGGGAGREDEEAVLFCPRCGAPQLKLQEHMRVEEPKVSTTGTVPPPRPAGARAPGAVDWQAAIVAAVVVAAVGAALSVLGLKFVAASLLGTVWTLCGAVVALGIYARRRPAAMLNARAGARIGVVAGLLMVAVGTMALAATGVVVRFGTHGMAQFDADNAQERRELQAKVLGWMEQQNQDKEVQQKYKDAFQSPAMNSPEMIAGSVLGGRAMQGLLIVLISAAGGAFAGRMRGAQRMMVGRRRGD